MQVSMRLKSAVMWDHHGTYMDGVGFRYRKHRITVDLGADDNLAGECTSTLCKHCILILQQAELSKEGEDHSPNDGD